MGIREYQIRPMREVDRAEVLKLVQLGLEEQVVFAGACDPPEDDGFLEEELAEHELGIATGWEDWVVAEGSSGQLVGASWIRWLSDPLGPYATVRQIVVEPDWRGRGIGRALISEVEKKAKKKGVVMLLISSVRPNPAWRLYRFLGFTDLPEEYREDPNPEHVVLWKWYGDSEPGSH